MNIKSKNKIIIFSHGFGIQKDNLGLFTFIAEKIEKLGMKSVLFDYYEYNAETKEIFSTAFSEQAVKLQNKIDSVSANNPDSEIIIIAQSQGSIIPTLCDVKNISKIIGISPFFMTDRESVHQRYASRAGNSAPDFDGVSKRKHSNGQTTVIPEKYWQERFNSKQESQYSELGTKTSLVLIYGSEDGLVESADLTKVDNCKLIELPGNHDFTGESRDSLYNEVLKELTQ
ncbi:MAG: hypothetical protein Q9M91_06970 [Candidatus Dojkabacteria bacterium]|nr:hypothetical protein [Candidatus Dojkabacteria bacterium]MDQ7021534.1 hypothetical protein [Candidatus Dojkabacteria bacterium]